MLKRIFLFFTIGLLGINIFGSVQAQNVQVEPDTHFVTSKPFYQLRIYKIFERNKNAFQVRFRDQAVRIMNRYDFQIMAMWEAKSQDGIEFVYILKWPDELTMQRQWLLFLHDPEWINIKQESAKQYGTMVGLIEDKVMLLTSYSPPFDLTP